LKRIHIFKTGTHTASNGATLPFSEDDLKAAAASYDPSLHEAPIVVGHPKDNAPAFGWVQNLSYNDGNLYAVPHQVNPDFDEQTEAGAYKKVSASWYLPDHPNNPKPGQLYLRHVGFLGAQPPAIKGLEAVQFGDSDEGTLEFMAGAPAWTVAEAFKSLREFFIEKFGIEDANKALPRWTAEDIEDAARRPEPAPTAEPEAGFNEQPTGGSTMTEEELKAAQAQLEQDQADLASQRAEFEENLRREEAAAEARRKAQIADRVDALVTAGNIDENQRAEVQAFAESLPVDAVVEYAEGETTTKRSSLDIYLDSLANKRPPVDFTERSAGGASNDTADFDEATIAAKARQYRDEQQALGRTVSFTEATNHVIQQSAA